MIGKTILEKFKKREVHNDSQKMNIIKYTYGHSIPIISNENDFPEELLKNINNKKIKTLSSYKISKFEEIKSLTFRLMRKIKKLPFELLSIFINKVSIAENILADLELNSGIKFSSHSWVDVMGGAGVWTSAIENLSSKKVFNIDIRTESELKQSGLKVYSKNIINGNILDLKIDKDIDAIFIRSGLKIGILEQLLNNNPHIKTLVYCKIKHSYDGSAGLEYLFKNFNKFSIQRSNTFELTSISTLVFNSKSFTYDFHVFSK